MCFIFRLLMFSILALSLGACSDIVPIVDLPDSNNNKVQPYCTEDRNANSPFANSGETGRDGLAPSSAYTICTASHFQNLSMLSSYWGMHFVLKDQIDLSGFGSLNPIGNTTTNFTGSLNGENHSISNFIMSQPATDNIGLFGTIGSGGKVMHLQIHAASIYGNKSVAVLAGVNNGLVKQVGVSGNVTGSASSSQTRAAGLVGINSASGVIEDSFSWANVYGYDQSGGLVGLNSGKVERCYATGDVSGVDWMIGGLIGYSNGASNIVNNSFSTGVVSGNSVATDIGLFIGKRNGGNHSDNYYNSDSSCINGGGSCSSNGTGVAVNGNATYFFDPASDPLSNWDFSGNTGDGSEDIWHARPGDYPVLVPAAGVAH